MDSAEAYLSEQDPILAAVIKKQQLVERKPRTDYFESLASSIISQQISLKAAASIFERFKIHTHLDPSKVAALDDEAVKAIGLSGQKARYLRDLADHFVRDSAVFNHLNTLSDDEVISELTKVKGIGVWTAQMFLMFTLVRADVFAPDDRGLQIAIKKLYSFKDEPTRQELLDISSKWQPYRTVASWHLWQSLENSPDI